MSDWFVLDIPRPPSVNRFRGRLGNKSPCVVEWRARADQYLRAAGRYPRIIGPYELLVTFPLPQFGRYDPDNLLKALCDWLQSREIIENDRLARWLSVTWDEAPEGCRVHIRAYEVTA
jgi:Holliday junction resolvase RusA-like endonuclease